MDLQNVIKNIIDGDAVIIMGSGASIGIRNSQNNPFPSGKLLAARLYEACGEISSDAYDLADASELYKEKFSSQELISEIRTQLTVGHFEDIHQIVYSLPWIRYYTTNYDDAALFAARKSGKRITPITLSKNFRKFRDYENLCVHINGHIGELNEETLRDEFKLTSSSYLSMESIINSQWGALLKEDLAVAKNIVIIGLSLNYDLDLSRIIYNTNTKEKTIFIDREDLDPSSQRKLERFGKVYNIGVDGFAKQVAAVHAYYHPRQKDPSNYLYSCFNHEYKKNYPLITPIPNDIFELVMTGQFSDSLTFEKDGDYESIVFRKSFKDVLEGINANKRIIFVHSALGNGKTMLVNVLRHQLSRKDIHVFLFIENYQAKLATDISNINNLNQKTVVIIEDYFNYMEVLRGFSTYALQNVTFVLTARSAINETRLPDVCSMFSIKEGESIIIDANKLIEPELLKCSDIFTKYGIFGRNNKRSTSEKLTILKDKHRGNSSFQTILIDIAQSNDMESRVMEIVETIKNDTNKYYDTIILILLAQIMKLRISADDISEIMRIDITRDAIFQKNIAVNELLIFQSDEADFRIKSAVTANLILKNINNMQPIISALIKTAQYSSKYSYTEKYNNILINIISYSHINSFLKGFTNREQFLLNYYDNLSELSYYRENHFFWLQYAIACIEMKNYPRAQTYLNNSYGFAPPEDRFIPFQINNQQARLYLEKIQNGQSSNIIDDLKRAHELLMMPIISSKDNEGHVIRLFEYYHQASLKEKFITSDEISIYKQCCKEAHVRLENYLKNPKSSTNNYSELKRQLILCAI